MNKHENNVLCLTDNFIVTLYLVIKNQKHRHRVFGPCRCGSYIYLGISSIEDIIRVWDIVWNATFTFISIIIISLILDEAGFLNI